MKLHANAPLGPKGRLIMVRRVLEEGWSLTEAAEAAGVSERTAGKWVAPLPRRRRGGPARPQLGARRGPQRAPPEDRVEAIAALRRLRMTGPEIAELLGDGALDGLGGAEADRPGQAQPPGAAGAAQPLRARAAPAS